MPTLSFTPTAAGNMNRGLFLAQPSAGPGQLSYATGYLTNANSCVAAIRLMQGTFPTNWSELSAVTSRSADVLSEVTNAGNQIINISTFATFNASPSAVNPIVSINTPNFTASASGTATWFWFLNYSSTNVILQQMIGTVTAIGGGGDLEISSTNIVSGNTYRISNLRINFPNDWNY